MGTAVGPILSLPKVSHATTPGIVRAGGRCIVVPCPESARLAFFIMMGDAVDLDI
ncbi:MAG TPA: hypothetical protein DEF41_09005 [Desulfovibrio sp.]|nr:hypothetical protein [Desulfovibrio sp.]